MYIKVTQEEITSWIDMNKTISIQEISDKTGRNIKTIYKWFNRVGFAYNSHMYRKASRGDLMKYYKIYHESPNYTYKQFAADLGIAPQNLDKKFKRYNLERKPLSITKHKQINDTFFSYIDSEIKAYLLGFFAADGHIERRRDYYTYCLKIGLHKKDVEILHLYNKYVANDLCTILYPVTKPTMCLLNIHSTRIGEDLLKLGYDNRKTYTSNSLPNIPNEMINHFIRGYFDGDGCVMVNKRKRGYNRVVNIAASNENILKEIFDCFQITTNKVYVKRVDDKQQLINGNMARFSETYYYEVRDVVNFQLIFNYLYSDSHFFLSRKYNKFLYGINTIRT